MTGVARYDGVAEWYDRSALPFAEASFGAAVSVFTHTDMDDFAGVLRELARVLRPDAPFVYLGAHPYFVG